MHGNSWHLWNVKGASRIGDLVKFHFNWMTGEIYSRRAKWKDGPFLFSILTVKAPNHMDPIVQLGRNVPISMIPPFHPTYPPMNWNASIYDPQSCSHSLILINIVRAMIIY